MTPPPSTASSPGTVGIPAPDTSNLLALLVQHLDAVVGALSDGRLVELRSDHLVIHDGT
jgi:hypothetical protein